MALPSFVSNATGLDDGVANNLAAGISKLRTFKGKVNNLTSEVDNYLKTIDGNNLPSLPTITDINLGLVSAETQLNMKINELGVVADLAGTCLDSAIGALKSIASNAFGFLEEIVDALQYIANIPAQMFNIYKIYGYIQEFIKKLGIDKLVADIYSKLGCLSDSSVITDVNNEVSSLLYELGLNGSGELEDNTFYDKMKSDLSFYATQNGISTSFADDMTDGLSIMTAKTNEFSDMVKNSVNEKLVAAKSSIKNSIAKAPTSPSFF